MKYLYLLTCIGLMYSPVNAEVFWQAYITKNNDKTSTVIAQGVEVATATVRLDLPGFPVKAEVKPAVDGTAPNGVAFKARLLTIEFLDGTGAAIGTVCATGHPGNGGASTIMLQRYNMLYQIDLTCLDVLEDPK